jgi:hypothetical protein
LAPVRALLTEHQLSAAEDLVPALGSGAQFYVELSKLASFPNAVLTLQGADNARLQALLIMLGESLAIAPEVRGEGPNQSVHFSLKNLGGLLDGGAPAGAVRNKPGLASFGAPCLKVHHGHSVLALHERGLAAAVARMDAAGLASSTAALEPAAATLSLCGTLDLQRILTLAVTRGGVTPPWLAAAPLRALLEDADAGTLIPAQTLWLCHHEGTTELRWQGAEIATLLSAISCLILDGTSVPPLVLQHLPRHVGALSRPR